MASLLVSAALFAVSLTAMLAASNLFVTSAERLSLAFGVSPFLVGATVVAGGTSMPELVSSLLAAAQGAPGIVLGTVVGSNVANLFLVLGLASVAAGTLQIERELVRVDLPLLTASAVFLVVAGWDGVIAWYEGVLGLLGLGIYLDFSLSSRQRLDEVVGELVEEFGGDATDEGDVTVAETVSVEPDVGLRTYATLAIALVVLFVAADQLVGSILSVASSLALRTEVVAMTAVAVGTSLPEVVVSVTAVRGDSSELAVGNVLGSNVFNTFAVVGVPSFLAPLAVSAPLRGYSLPVMLLATLLYFFVTQNREVTRWEGLTWLLLYAVFLANIPL